MTQSDGISITIPFKLPPYNPTQRPHGVALEDDIKIGPHALEAEHEQALFELMDDFSRDLSTYVASIIGQHGDLTGFDYRAAGQRVIDDRRVIETLFRNHEFVSRHHTQGVDQLGGLRTAYRMLCDLVDLVEQAVKTDRPYFITTRDMETKEGPTLKKRSAEKPSNDPMFVWA